MRIIINNLLFFSFLYPSLNIIDEGLSYQIFTNANESSVNTSEIVIITIDPNFYNINLFSSKDYNHDNLTVKEWSEKHGLIIAVNAGMFQEDYLSNVGYMKQFDSINNSNINHYQSIAAFNPKDTNKDKFKIFDIEKINGVLDTEYIKSIIDEYETVIQNLRLVKRSKENRWPQQVKKWSEVALGEDSSGNILLIFSRAPYSMHDLNNILIDLPINLECAQHLEGGPEASIYLKYNDIELKYIGSYESLFMENNNNNIFWEVPNIIGISKK